VDEVYAAVGAVLTLSGRAVRPELLISETPTIQNAIDLISRLIEEVSGVQDVTTECITMML